MGGPGIGEVVNVADACVEVSKEDHMAHSSGLCCVLQQVLEAVDEAVAM